MCPSLWALAGAAVELLGPAVPADRHLLEVLQVPMAEAVDLRGHLRKVLRVEVVATEGQPQRELFRSMELLAILAGRLPSPRMLEPAARTGPAVKVAGVPPLAKEGVAVEEVAPVDPRVVGEGVTQALLPAQEVAEAVEAVRRSEGIPRVDPGAQAAMVGSSSTGISEVSHGIETF